MPHLRVIRASAGSGKTHALTGEFLSLALTDPDYFRHILAVTFTNKATNEMKSRIVQQLHRLASGKPSPHLGDLVIRTGLPEIEIRIRSEKILKRLLHYYSGFSVSTIDSFFQRIIRSFTRELGLQGNYSIELDTDSLLTTVIDRLLARAESDRSLLEWLGSYAESQIEQGDNWSLRQGIHTLGKEIFREEFRSFPDQVVAQFGNRALLREYRKELYSRFRVIGNTYSNFGQQAEKILDETGLRVDDFFKKSAGPAGFLLKLKSGEFKAPSEISRQAAKDPGKWYTKQATNPNSLREIAETRLMPLLQKALDYYDRNYRDYNTCDAILKNIYNLGILSDLSALAYQWCNENNAFLLPEAPVFLQKIIDGNDTPFIYEKAGYWYNHFMIDEFQDTSLLQWVDFKPLISNSLSQDHGNLVVGDVKQSIYRWRNSDWTILAQGIELDFPSGIVKNETLHFNRRSGRKIIEFNNWFFQDAAAMLEQDFLVRLGQDGYAQDSFGMNPVTGIYTDAVQEPATDNHPAGRVEISFVEDDGNGFQDNVNDRLVTLLGELKDKGYGPGDIAIITRKNSEAKQLADFLLNYQNNHPETGNRFDVISDEALRLGSSSTVVFLVSLIRYLLSQDKGIGSYYILSFFKNHLARNVGDRHWEMPGNSDILRDQEIKGLLPEEFFALDGSADAISLAEITERLISIFELDRIQGEQVYLNAFRDLVQEYGQKNATDPFRFLEYWDDAGKERSVSAPEGQEAIRILTVHKAKGLQFRIVILPYCNWTLNPVNRSFLWCKPQDAPFDKLGMVPVVYSSKLRDTGFAGKFYDEFLKQFIDNLNLLYVAFTRARSGLFIFCRTGKEDALRNVSVLVRRVLRNRFIPHEEGYHSDLWPGSYDKQSDRYYFGELPEERTGTEKRWFESIPPAHVSVGLVAGRIKVAYQGSIYIDPKVRQPKRPLNKGRILHEIFSAIRTKDDIARAVTGIHLRGKISSEERHSYISEITHLMNDIQVLSWFTDDWHILTEAEVILPGGMSRRPDRIMTRDGQTVVIDYKFGEKTDPSYNTQVKAYLGLMKEMGHDRVEGFIWYVMLGKVVSVNEP